MISKRTSNRPPLGASTDKLNDANEHISLSPHRDSHSVGYNLGQARGFRGGALKNKIQLETITSPTGTSGSMAHSSVLGGANNSHNLRSGPNIMH